jgi:hypothetical protein
MDNCTCWSDFGCDNWFPCSFDCSAKPNVEIEVKPDADNKSRIEVQLTNTGSQPATNLSLAIDSSMRVVNIINKFSTANIFLQKDNTTLEVTQSRAISDNVINLYIQKLIQGLGSIVRIETVVDGKFNQYYNNDRFDVYAVYDQGSTMGKIDPLYDSLTRVLFEPFILMYFIVLYIPIIIFYYYYFVRWTAKHFMRRLVDNARNVHNAIKEDIMTRQSFSQFLSDAKNCNNQFKKEISNNFYVLNFYEKLDTREKKKVSDIAESELRPLNDECFSASEQVLRRIDWSEFNSGV